MLILDLKKPNLPYGLLTLGISYGLLFCLYLPRFLNWNMNLYIGLLLAPYIGNIKPQQLSIRYVLPTLFALVLVFFIPVKTLYFIALVFAILLLIESSLGKISEALLLLLLLISPVFKYLVATVDFPIRLWLTKKVVYLLNKIGIESSAAGNLIEMQDHSFAVDPACAGLNMLAMSLIICLFLIINFQKSKNKSLNIFFIASLFTITICLNILSNFFRILVLVIFKIMPDNFFHDLVGIACLSIYVFLPLIPITKLIITLFGEPIKKSDTIAHYYHVHKIRLLNIAILSLFIFLGTRLASADTLTSSHPSIQLSGFEKKQLPTGILKFENQNALIYIKPAAFYIPEHDPKLCWTGSGYTFNNIKKTQIANTEIYTALLTKGKDKIYSAWWFDDGETKTVDQLLWRWKSAKQSGQFYLINVNALDSKSLTEQVAIMLVKKNYLSAIKMKTKAEQLKKRAKLYIWIIIIGLVLSGITAFPLTTELAWLSKIGIWPLALQQWLLNVYLALQNTNHNYPFLAYGTDWLAFAHLLLAVLFIGPLRKPVTNIWIIEFGIIACILVIPLALIAGHIREIPFFWRLIDCAFGLFAAVPLTLCYLAIQKLKKLNPNDLSF